MLTTEIDEEDHSVTRRRFFTLVCKLLPAGTAGNNVEMLLFCRLKVVAEKFLWGYRGV